MSQADHPLNSQLRFSAEEDILYARRFEEGYDLIDPKYEHWLSIHHPIVATVISNKAPVTGLRVTSSVTSLHVDVPVVSSATISSTPPAHCSHSQTNHETLAQCLTPVHPIVEPNPLELKLPDSTSAHSSSALALVDSDTPSSNSSTLSPRY